MPIYAYKCASCGHAKDVLQKISDLPLSVCPACGAASFTKQVTAAGFQLKGSGWYVTDFRDSNKKKDAKAAEAGSGAAPGEVAKGDGATSDSAKSDGTKIEGARSEGAKGESTSKTSKPAESTAAPASPPPASPSTSGS
jgi:putative FmdB family regulatory protein